MELMELMSCGIKKSPPNFIHLFIHSFPSPILTHSPTPTTTPTYYPLPPFLLSSSLSLLLFSRRKRFSSSHVMSFFLSLLTPFYLPFHPFLLLLRIHTTTYKQTLPPLPPTTLTIHSLTLSTRTQEPMSCVKILIDY